MEAPRRQNSTLYAAGAYIAYPALAAAGGALLAAADSAAAILAAIAVLGLALALPAWLGFYCRRCGERPLPKFLRLTVLPATIAAALAFRSPNTTARVVALLLLALSAMAFKIAWRLAGIEEEMPGADRRMLGDEKPEREPQKAARS